jgi:site-specific DNA-methyltransferase (adenine-specific)
MNKIDLYNGDCLEVMKSLQGNSIDAIITDLPYGTTACKWDNIISFKNMWLQIERIKKNKSVVCLFGNQPFSTKLINSNIDNYKYDWIWNKKQTGNPLNAKIQPLKIYENIHIFYKHNYYPIMRIGKMRTKGGLNKQPKHINKVNLNYRVKNNQYYPTAILEFSNANKRNKVHSTQKPIELIEYLIKTYTKEKETILDFTMGSGTTGIACINTNRNFIGIELDKNYFNISKKRIEEHRKQLRLF